MRPESIRQNLVFYADGVGANQKVTIAMTKVGSPVHIYWGDGTECWNTDFTGNITHTYEETGSKKIIFLQPADGWERLTSLVISSSYLSRYLQGFKWMKGLATLTLSTNPLIPEADIDKILTDLDESRDRFGDRVACTVTLGGTTDAPSDVGVAAKERLAAAGWTLTTNENASASRSQSPSASVSRSVSRSQSPSSSVSRSASRSLSPSTSVSPSVSPSTG